MVLQIILTVLGIIILTRGALVTLVSLVGFSVDGVTKINVTDGWILISIGIIMIYLAGKLW